MPVSILLLDCSSLFEEKLKRQGFNVAHGTIGYASRYRHLSSPFYEHEVIIYNPSYFSSATDLGDWPLFAKPDTLRNHIRNGAVCLVFANHLSESVTNLNMAYSWLPFMPPLGFTMDFKPLSGLTYGQQADISLKRDILEALSNYRPLMSEFDVKIPVRIKLRDRDYGGDRPDLIPLFFNKQADLLGAALSFGSGKFIVLPQYKDNDSTIVTFLNRVLPRIIGAKGSTDIVDAFVSPDEHVAVSEIQRLEAERAKLEEDLEKARESKARAERAKVVTIGADETARFLINYFKQAQQQDDVALFYLYKIIEILEKKFGNETAAKQRLGCNAEWNFVGKVANASYGDIRHAPRPGEKIKEWSEEDIKKCFEGAEKIIYAYFTTLF